MHSPTRGGKRPRPVQRIQLVEESRGLLLLPRHGRHQQAATRPSDRYVEQSPFLGQLGGDGRHAGRVPAG
jgi:hypothetical protein